MAMYQTFFYQITFIISYIYLALKIKDYLLEKSSINTSFLRWYAVIIASLLSILLMMQSYEYNGMYFDTRCVPIFLISIVGGPLRGGIASIPPIMFRGLIGMNGMWEEVLLCMILPWIVGSLLHSKEDFKPPVTVINIKKLILGFVVLSVLKFMIGQFILDLPWDFWIKYNVLITVFSFASVVIISYMINDSNKQLINEYKLEHQSHYDPLTNLSNRRHCQLEVMKIINNNEAVAVAMADIDFFKHYNDTNGHAAGDVVIKGVANILKNNIRENDFVARYGGEEFILFFRNLGREDVEHVVERIRHYVEVYPFEGRETQPEGKVTISIGVSISAGEKSLEQLIKESDEALYDSKNNGRNRISFY